ncbi:MAG: phenylalanine--tRNA ligase subunit beta [Candidatus Paceibacterota bacterium]|jgi:phenylalanyl-tRNA synthetase beta chain
MLFSYNWLQEFFPKKLPAPQKLAELLTMHFMEVEGLEKCGQDWVLNIDVLPSRGGDCFCHFGVAKECGLLAGLKIQPADYDVEEDKKITTKNLVKADIQDKIGCRRYTARLVKDVKIGPAPEAIKAKMASCGLQSINNVVDATNYVMLEMGQPLHAFDADKLVGGIVVRRAKKGEKILSLSGVEYELDEKDLVIADSKGILAIAGIKGGRRAEIDENTKTIILESANFDPASIRRTSRRLNLKTDASWRFEHNLDPNLSEIAIDRVASLIQEMAGGIIAGGRVDVYPKKTSPKILKFDLNSANSLLGADISEAKMISILKGLGLGVKPAKKGIVSVAVPTWRQDINLEADLIEEIGRVYGLDNIKPVFPCVDMAPAKRNNNIFWEGAAKDALKEAGLSEVYNYSLLFDKQAETFGFHSVAMAELKNPVNVGQKYLRPSLLPHLLNNIKIHEKIISDQSSGVDISEARIFELSKVFYSIKKGGKDVNEEKAMLSGAALGNGKVFYEIKKAVDLLMDRLGAGPVNYEEAAGSNVWHPGVLAEIKIGKETVGLIGEISPKISSELEISQGVIAFDIDFEKLQKFCTEERIYRPIPKFPPTTRDLAVLVPVSVKAGEVLDVIKASGGELASRVSLFDVYEGKNLPQGKKNLAFQIIYRSLEKTLTNQEADISQNNIIKALEANPGWEVRK